MLMISDNNRLHTGQVVSCDKLINGIYTTHIRKCHLGHIMDPVCPSVCPEPAPVLTRKPKSVEKPKLM